LVPLFLTPNRHHGVIHNTVNGGFKIAFRALPQCRDHLPHLSRPCGVPPPRPHLHYFLDERFFHLLDQLYPVFWGQVPCLLDDFLNSLHSVNLA
jgi:hypothetical protein